MSPKQKANILAMKMRMSKSRRRHELLLADKEATGMRKVWDKNGNWYLEKIK